jgi:dienelactone hydrolase
MIALSVPASVEAGGSLECYVATPPAGVAPAACTLLYLTDIFGHRFVNAQLLADTYAAAGVCVYMPNFLGTLAGGAPDAVPAATLDVNDEAPAAGLLGRAWQGLRFTAAVPSLVPFLMRHGEAVTAPRVAAVAAAVRALLPAGAPLAAAGFCFGGGPALRLAGGAAPAVDAVIAVHPSGITLPRDAEALARPALFCLAVADFAFSSGAVASFKTAIEKRAAAAPPVKWLVYEGHGIGHGFAVRGGHHTDAARAKCAADVVDFVKSIAAKAT